MFLLSWCAVTGVAKIVPGSSTLTWRSSITRSAVAMRYVDGYGLPQQVYSPGGALPERYGDYDDSGYNGQQGPPRIYAPQDYRAPVLWSVLGFSGVTGFTGVAEKYCTLPYSLRSNDEFVLSRKNMVHPQLTVSRIQAIVQAFPDSTAMVTSHGRGPTLWRGAGSGGQWSPLFKGEWRFLEEGDQVSLDCNNPENAVFACVRQQAVQRGGYLDQHYGAQQVYGAEGYGGMGSWGDQQRGW